MTTTEEERKRYTLIKQIEIKKTSLTIDIYEDGAIVLPTSEIDYSLAIHYIDSLQKSIEFLREQKGDKNEIK